MKSRFGSDPVQPTMLPYQAVIFDVDGTLVDSFEHFIAILNLLAPKYAFGEMNQDKIEQLRALAPRQIRKTLNLSMLSTFRLIYDCKKEMNRRGQQPTLFPGIVTLIQQLKQQQIRLGIVTSNSKQNCQQYLGPELFQLFDWVECNASIYGKARQLRKIIQRTGLPPDQVIYIGDQIIDIESAHKNGIPCAAVTWGFNSANALQQYQPHHVIDEVPELYRLLLPAHELHAELG